MDGQRDGSALIVEQRRAVRYLTLNRPEVLNARIVDQLVPSTTHVYKAPDSAINNKGNHGARDYS
jgi:enoyl-CoA hydratase/carnithine racemase